MISFGFVKRSTLAAILSGQPRQAVVSKEKTRTRTVQVFAAYGEGDTGAVIAEVLAERQRQVAAEGFSTEHDQEHDGGTLAAAASAYALYATDMLHPQSQGDGGYDKAPPPMWPWYDELPSPRGGPLVSKPAWWKPQNPRRALVKAAALIVAEIERIDRLQLPK